MNMNNSDDFERGITKLGRSKSLINLASCESFTFPLGMWRKSRSSISLETLSSTKAGNNEAESKLVQVPNEVVTPYVPSLRCDSCSKSCLVRLPLPPCAFFKPEDPPVLCSKCYLEHFPPPPPLFKYCDTCFTTHENFACPYERSLPQGAKFNRVKFTVACTSDGMPFDEDKWACIMCYGKKAKAAVKCCVFCRDFGNHCSYECPKYVVEAAKFKAYIDNLAETASSMKLLS